MKKYYGPDFLTVSVLDTVKSFILTRHISLIHPPYNLTSRRLTSRRMTSRRMTLVNQLASWSDCSFHKKNGPASLSRSRVVSFDVTQVDVTSDDVSQLVRLWFSSKKTWPSISLSRSRVVSFEWRERERFVKLVRGTRGGRRCQKQSENRSECHKTKIVRFKVSYRDGLEQRGAPEH